MAKKKKKRKTKSKLAGRTDRHHLYEEAVQPVDMEIDMFRRWMRRRWGTAGTRLREDFCGTARLATDWILADATHTAWGVDLDAAPLQWSEAHHRPRLADRADALTLLRGDVRQVETPPVDIVAALNFSYNAFKTREDLRSYLEAAAGALDERGLVVLDVFGGTESTEVKKDIREVPSSTAPDGTTLPSFHYVWRQEAFNPITHELRCRIDFRFSDGSRQKRAFEYDWRLWTLPEIQELMRDAGLRPEVYLHGFDEDGDSDEVYRRRTRYDNTLGWVAYVAGWREPGGDPSRPT